MSLWFTENDFEEIQYGYAIKDILYSGRSEFQDLKVYETKAYGRMLVLDDFVMLTESDEFVYHEMISHIPMAYSQNPKKVLVVGGGDGGTVRELAKYKDLEKIVLCEIDKKVVDVSREFFPGLTSALDDPRVEIVYKDAVEFIKSSKAHWDIILIDSTDPIGPGEGLFTGSFYKSVKEALTPNGIMVAQTESPWAKAEMLRKYIIILVKDSAI